VPNAYGQDASPDGLTAAARGAATRKRIIREAFVLIGEVGWSRVTTRLLASRAGVKAALINYHFRSKDSLLREAAAAGIAELVGPAIDRMVRAGDPAMAIADVLRFLAGELTPAQGRSFLELSMRALDDAEVGRLMTEQLRAFRSLVAQGPARPDVEPTGLAVILVGLLDGVLLQRTIDPETDVDAAARALRRLLRAPDGTTPEEET